MRGEQENAWAKGKNRHKGRDLGGKKNSVLAGDTKLMKRDGR